MAVFSPTLSNGRVIPTKIGRVNSGAGQESIRYARGGKPALRLVSHCRGIPPARPEEDLCGQTPSTTCI